MKIKTITLKGWANNSDLLFSKNVKNKTFLNQFNELKKELLKKGFKELNITFDTLRGKNASEKIVVKGWYWLGSWNDPKKQTYSVFFK